MIFCVLSIMQNECFRQKLMVKPKEQGDRGLNLQSTLLFLREPAFKFKYVILLSLCKYQRKL